MDDFAKTALNWVSPPKEKTVVQQCEEYIRENPGTVVKGAAIGVATWFTVPIVIAGVSWLPYIGAGYYLYNYTQTVQRGYSWYKWGRDNIL